MTGRTGMHGPAIAARDLRDFAQDSGARVGHETMGSSGRLLGSAMIVLAGVPAGTDLGSVQNQSVTLMRLGNINLWNEDVGAWQDRATLVPGEQFSRRASAVEARPVQHAKGA